MTATRKRVRAKKNATLADRLALHSIDAPSGCRVWVGARDDKGYGRVAINGSSGYAHRASYELHKGPIVDGLVVDHLCRYRACINPLHLQAVTHQINMLRGTSPGARAQRRERCPAGHAYAEHGAVISGRRRCRKCRNEYHRQWRERQHRASLTERAARMGRLEAIRDGAAA